MGDDLRGLALAAADLAEEAVGASREGTGYRAVQDLQWEGLGRAGTHVEGGRR
jgi:hypothetical protein